MKWLCVVLALAVMSACGQSESEKNDAIIDIANDAAASVAEPLESRIDDLESTQEEMQAKIDELESQVANQEAEIANLQLQIRY